jgi:hypothetical protein
MAKGEKDGIDRRGALECMIWASDFTPRNCSPDFAFWQLGSRTIWNPSEEFDVGVDVLYNKIDTAFSGRVALCKTASCRADCITRRMRASSLPYSVCSETSSRDGLSWCEAGSCSIVASWRGPPPSHAKTRTAHVPPRAVRYLSLRYDSPFSIRCLQPEHGPFGRSPASLRPMKCDQSKAPAVFRFDLNRTRNFGGSR